MLWTRHSIIVVRMLLWLFHTLTLACFLSVVSLAVYQHAAEETEENKARAFASIHGIKRNTAAGN